MRSESENICDKDIFYISFQDNFALIFSRRNKSAGPLLSYEGLPEGLKTQLLVRTKEDQDPEMMAERKELVKQCKPTELGDINGLGDFPLPAMVETLVRPSKRHLKSTKEKGEMKKRSKSWSSLPEGGSQGWYNSLPRGLKTELLVKNVEQDTDLVKERQETVKRKSISDLAAINGFSDFPVPDVIEKIWNPDKHRVKSKERSRSASPEKEKTMYEKLPGSLKAELLVKQTEEDQDCVKKNQELVRSMSPSELGNINSLSDFPVPSFRSKSA